MRISAAQTARQENQEAAVLAEGMEITLSDMGRLSADPSADTRASIAGKMAATLSAGKFSPREQALALEILRLLAGDVEVRVRAALAAQLGDCLAVPHDMVLALAQDTGVVAVPLLAHSYALSEDDLIAIVHSTRELAKLLAIAGRESVSAGLSEALLDTDILSVMEAVLANRGAALEEHALMARWERVAGERSLLAALVARGGLSVRVAERIYTAVSDDLKEKLTRMYRLPASLMGGAAEEAREWAMQELTHAAKESGVQAPADALPLAALVDKLYAFGCLTPSMAIRALCMGDLAFFEAALARLAEVSPDVARILMLDRGPLGLHSLYERAHLPEAYFPALKLVLEFALEETDYGRLSRRDFHHRVRARIQAAGHDRTVEHMGELLALIDSRGVHGERHYAARQTVH